jgi:hypothetical protein
MSKMDSSSSFVLSAQTMETLEWQIPKDSRFMTNGRFTKNVTAALCSHTLALNQRWRQS